MEGGKCRRVIMVVSLMVLAMVVLAQAQDPARARGEAVRGGLIHPDGGVGECAAKCGPSCLLELFPPKIAICFGLCMVTCKLQPSPSVYQCTSGCANSMLNAFNPTGAEKVENFVGSCYKNCKQHSIN